MPFDPIVPVAAVRILAALRHGAPPNPSYRRSSKNFSNIRMRHQWLFPNIWCYVEVCAELRSSTRQTMLWNCMPGHEPEPYEAEDTFSRPSSAMPNVISRRPTRV